MIGGYFVCILGCWFGVWDDWVFGLFRWCFIVWVFMFMFLRLVGFLGFGCELCALVFICLLFWILSFGCLFCGWVFVLFCGWVLGLCLVLCYCLLVGSWLGWWFWVVVVEFGFGLLLG